MFSALSLTPIFRWVGERAGLDPNRFSGFWLAFTDPVLFFRDSHIRPCNRGLDGLLRV